MYVRISAIRTSAIYARTAAETTRSYALWKVKDVSAIERSGGFDGVYHVLHGLLSPMNSIGPQQLKIKELMARLSDTDEVIMATSPTIEGEATATYLSRMIKQLGVKVTRLAYGLPAGASLEYADDVTLQRALENRNEI